MDTGITGRSTEVVTNDPPPLAQGSPATSGVTSPMHPCATAELTSADVVLATAPSNVRVAVWPGARSPMEQENEVARVRPQRAPENECADSQDDRKTRNASMMCSISIRHG